MSLHSASLESLTCALEANQAYVLRPCESVSSTGQTAYDVTVLEKGKESGLSPRVEKQQDALAAEILLDEFREQPEAAAVQRAVKLFFRKIKEKEAVLPDNVGELSAREKYMQRHFGIDSAVLKRRDEKICALRDAVVAHHFDLPEEVLAANPGLAAFLDHNHMKHYLKRYGHRIEFDPADMKAKLLYQGESLAWSNIQARVNFDPYHRLRGHVYSFDGIRPGSIDGWTKLEPSFFDDAAKWGGGYALTVCANCGDKPAIRGDHCWIRLHQPNGGIISVGQYRPTKIEKHEHWLGSTAIKPSLLYQPDISEFYPAPYTEFTLKIDKEGFQRAVDYLESMHAQGEEYYQLLHYNCPQLVVEIAELQGYHLPSTMHTARMLAPERVVRIADAVNPYLPGLVSKVCDTSLTVTLNLLQLGLGGGSVHPVLKEGEGPVPKPIISSFWDLFDGDKVQMHHPFVLGQVARQRIEEWREEEISELQRLMLENEDVAAQERLSAEIERIRFDAPPEYKCEIRHPQAKL